MKKILLTVLLILTIVSCGGSKSEKLVVYTNSGSNGRAERLTELAKEAGFDITVVSAGGTETSNRLQAEKNKPIADVVFGLNAIEYEKLKAQGILEKFTPEWAKDIPEGLSDPEGYYNAVTQTYLLAVYNEEAIGKDVPADWVDLATNPKFKDKYAVYNVDGGTGKTVYASIVSRYKDPNGDLGISEEGWKVAEQYFGNGHINEKNEDTWGNMMSGKYPVLQMWSSGAIERSKTFNYDYGVMQPAIGVPVVVEQLAIISGTKHRELAEKFINWLGAEEQQVIWAQEFGTTPALPKALEKAPKANRDLVEKVGVQKMDWKFIAENIDSWIEKAQLQYIR